jgi:hypothetical protein
MEGDVLASGGPASLRKLGNYWTDKTFHYVLKIDNRMPSG